MKKNIYRVLLIIVFFMIALTIKSYGESDLDYDYAFDTSGNIVITSYMGSDSNITIPSTIDGYKVIAIGEHAFDGSSSSTNGNVIENVIISEGIEKIGTLAFAKCANLETVKLPESLTFIDMQAFLLDTKLKSINIPSNLTTIMCNTFQETALTEVEIPEGMQSIQSRAFGICSQLEKVTIHSRNVQLDSSAFEYSNSLVLYGYEGSTTQAYAQQNGIEFRALSSSQEPTQTVAIKLNKNSLSLNEGSSETLTVSFTGIPSSTNLIWTSSNSNIATVEYGTITAKSEGNATITVKTEDGQYQDTCTVLVTKQGSSTETNIVPITSISLSKSSLSLKVNNTATLVATILPNNATDTKLVWSSSNSNIATVDNGKITAKAVGNALITVSNSDGTKKATCNVTVTKTGTGSDATTATGRIPQTGINVILTIITSLVVISIAAIMYKKYSGFKDVK